MTLTPEQIVRDLQRTIPVFQQEAVTAMRAATKLTREREIVNMPKRTGKLERATVATVRENSTGVSGSVAPRGREMALLASRLNEGTGHFHPIKSKSGKAMPIALRDGTVIYRKTAKGVPATHYIDRTRAEVARAVEDELAAGAERASRRLFR